MASPVRGGKFIGRGGAPAEPLCGSITNASSPVRGGRMQPGRCFSTQIYTDLHRFKKIILFGVFCVFSVKVPLRGTCSPACCDQAARTFGPLAWSLDKMRTLGNPNKFGFLSLNRIFRTKSGLRPTTASSTQNIILNTGFCRCPIIFSVCSVYSVCFSHADCCALCAGPSGSRSVASTSWFSR